MDPIHIHNLLRQLANEVSCPQCNAKVRPDMIHVENSTQNYCLLKIECYSCGEVFHGHAHVGVKIAPPQINTTIPRKENPLHMRKLPPSPPPITELDIEQLKSALQDNDLDISQFFSQRK